MLHLHLHPWTCFDRPSSEAISLDFPSGLADCYSNVSIARYLAPRQLSADIQGMQGCVLPAATQFLSLLRKRFCRPRVHSHSEVRPTAALITLSFLTASCASPISSSLRLAKVRPRADGRFRLSARRLHACAPGNDLNFTGALGRKYACHQPLSVPSLHPDYSLDYRLLVPVPSGWTALHL
jgi:hypothetical protein